MISLALDIDVPTPSQFVSHAVVDDIALACNRLYRQHHPNQHGTLVDTDLFIDLLEISTLWEDIEEPEHAAFFASFSPDNDGLITINKRHSELFKKRRMCIPPALVTKPATVYYNTGRKPDTKSLPRFLAPRRRINHGCFTRVHGFSTAFRTKKLKSERDSKRRSPMNSSARRS